MKDDNRSVSTGSFYELVETESGYKLLKLIANEGKEWLDTATYTVYIDPSIQTIENAYLISGVKTSTSLVTSGQLITNYTIMGSGQGETPHGVINPASGHQLTLTMTDLTIPGRGLDVTLTRFYETPAVFYGLSPYDHESPPVSIGKG
jgi:hypothetical protein